MIESAPHPMQEATLTSSDALTIFGSPDATADQRRSALTVLITKKLLPKNSGDPAVMKGRAILASHASSAVDPRERLLAIAESVRLGQVVKKWSLEMRTQLAPAFESELPAMSLLEEADDRLNVARACLLFPTAWMPAYLASSIAQEDTGEKARGVMLDALLSGQETLTGVLDLLTREFKALRPMTEAPAETLARRLTRTLLALRNAMSDSDIEVGEDIGKAFHAWISYPFGTMGRPQGDKVKVDLSRETLLAVHELVRSRISLAADPRIYRAPAFCRQLFGGASWPVELKKPLERLIMDVSEAILLLGRQGRCEQPLVSQLEILCNNPAQVKGLMKRLSQNHSELSEEVRYWLENGKQKSNKLASESAVESSASNADSVIGQAMQTVRVVRSSSDVLSERILENLEIYEPTLASPAKVLFDHIRVLLVQISQLSTLRGIGIYGVPGEEVDFSAKYFDAIEGNPRKRMIVKQSAVVKMREDGGIGDVVLKGLTE